MSLKTQGTHLFLRMEDSNGPSALKIKCPTGIQGLGGPRDQIDSTCLDDLDDRQYLSGLGNPGQVSVPFNYDPRAASHQLLYTLKEEGTTLQWLLGLSDGATTPTFDSNEDFEPMTTRSGFVFDAYVADVNIDISTNTIVQGTMVLQRSGKVRPFFKAV
ncbi:hypothetical protein L506_2316 [Bordetella bronchiseptica GA96-01]|uniref:phage tail tube protein n=1 Tax=Bordetella bronchiseptica TaxID=518 RepID=UPI00045A0888|nr:phage tail tube protein [Bordetella bronchiseptica]AZW31504.1 phage tail protein [Bordetella bronchiseptica]KCV40734.1 hypothetical protein L572_2344 [Bordetella bronchiseptica 345]KDC42128.1 hypothetical protein L506_2316 [Bordetella bronchiseptica GA96-01]